ncbi:hypothetical protein MTO96_017318 [Rhipicephalus appendiculatus]
MDTLLLSILACYLVLAPALKITEFRVPTKVTAETTVTLDCLFDLEGDPLYSVKWYKDDMEFYRFMPSSVPHRILFAVPRNNRQRKYHPPFPEENEWIDESETRLTQDSNSSSGFEQLSEDLLVVEPPDPPRHLMVVETTSRSVTLSWTAPQSNDIITSYEIQHKGHESNWNIDTVNSNVPGKQTSAVVSGLEPFTTYDFRVSAETTLGRSRASDPVRATTSGEAPGGPPVNISAQALSLQSVKLTWKPPSKDLHYGIIRGYYIGYRLATASSDPYIFQSSRRWRTRGRGDHFDVTVAVHALRRHRTGLSVVKTSGTSVTLEWKQPANDVNPVIGYHVLHTKADSGDQWKETIVPGSRHSLTIEKLSCGSTYRFAICAYNDAGTGNISDAVIVKTKGTRPVAPPDVRLAVLPRRRSAAILTSAWRDGGCPVESFTALLTTTTGGVHSYQWRVAPTTADAEQRYHEPLLEIRGLSPAHTYKVLLTAYNSAGSTEREYGFTTLTDSAKKPHKIHVPPFGLLYGTVRLDCSHGFGNEAAHTVKWFKDGDEFYRFVPGEEPSARTFRVEGVNVNMLESNATSVYLEKLVKPTAGTYSCEVSSETQSLRSTAEEELVIAERLPTTPRVSTSIVGETVELNCTGVRSEPSPTLSLFINDQLANSMTMLESHPRWPTHGHHSDHLSRRGQNGAERGHVRVRCEAAHSDALVATVEESIYVESPRWLLSRASSRRDQCAGKASDSLQ